MILPSGIPGTLSSYSSLSYELFEEELLESESEELDELLEFDDELEGLLLLSFDFDPSEADLL